MAFEKEKGYVPVMMKQLYYGFGSTSYFIERCFQTFDENRLSNSSVLLQNSQHSQIFQKYPQVKIEIVSRVSARPPTFNNTSELPFKIHKIVDSDKLASRNFKVSYSDEEILTLSNQIDTAIKKLKPDIIIFVQPPENPFGLILAELTKYNKIKLRIPHHTRLFPRSFWTNSPQEELEFQIPSQKHYSEAKNFVEKFQNGEKFPLGNPFTLANTEALPITQPSKYQKIAQKIRLFSEDNRATNRVSLYISIINSMPKIRELFWKIRKKRNLNFHKKNSNSPQGHFIYYPLQYTPESSINVPAPYFVDQMRLVDLIRYALPKNMKLAVKEHPSCISMRPYNFYQKLIRKSGVWLIHPKIQSQELIQNSELTISVTGTACLEAFFWGKPALVLGPCYFSSFLGGCVELSQLEKRIENAAKLKIEKTFIIEAVAKILASSNEFLCFAPDHDFAEMVSERNIKNFVYFLDQSL